MLVPAALKPGRPHIEVAREYGIDSYPPKKKLNFKDWNWPILYLFQDGQKKSTPKLQDGKNKFA